MNKKSKEYQDESQISNHNYFLEIINTLTTQPKHDINNELKI